MAESISRAEWLRLEIGAADDYIARHATDPDPVAAGQVLRRQREVAAFRAELAVRDATAAGNLIGAYVQIRYHGPRGIRLIESFVTDVDVDGEGVEVASRPSLSFPLEEVTLLEDGPIVDITSRGPELQPGPGLERATVYGVVVDVDGTVTRIAHPARHATIRRVLGEVEDLAVLTLPGGLVMFVDDHGHGRRRPRNPTATGLYGTGWPILGPVVVAHDDPHRPLDDVEVRLIELLAGMHARAAAPARETAAASVPGVVVRADGRRIMLPGAITAGVVRDVLHGRSTHVEAATWPHVPDDLRMVVTEQLAELPANHCATRLHAGGPPRPGRRRRLPPRWRPAAHPPGAVPVRRARPGQPHPAAADPRGAPRPPRRRPPAAGGPPQPTRTRRRAARRPDAPRQRTRHRPARRRA